MQRHLRPKTLWIMALVATLALVACGDDEDSSTATTSNGTTATSNGTTATSNGTTATSNGTTATSNGTTATSNGTTATSNGTTATSNGTTATSNGTTGMTDIEICQGVCTDLAACTEIMDACGENTGTLETACQMEFCTDDTVRPRVLAAANLECSASAPLVIDSLPPELAVLCGVEPPPVQFMVRVENISGSSFLPTPFSPGVAVVFDGNELDLINAGGEASPGLEQLAEDGFPGTLRDELVALADDGIAQIEMFNTPMGADAPAPIFPGDAYEFMIEATPETPFLALGTMLVQSNDLFLAPGEMPIPLFDEDGAPLPERNVAAGLAVWDAGTEVNEAPGFGHDQAPRQSEANTGAAEGVIHPYTHTTRAIPHPGAIVDVAVTETMIDGAEGFSITVTNTSADWGTLVTPIAPVFWAVHNGDWSLFENDADASPGLESLAEDGSPMMLVGEHNGADGTGAVGAQPITDQRPDDAPGPAFPGESYTINVAPTADHGWLSLAFMVVQSNDVFAAFGSECIPLVTPEGELRSAEMLQRAIKRSLAIWDAGTEANEVPGVGPNQAPRQEGANTGDDDPQSGVRLYRDNTNDLDGPGAGGFIEVTIVNGETDGDFDITITNNSDTTVFPGVLTPVAWALHPTGTTLFEAGGESSPGLAMLAEVGMPGTLLSELSDAGLTNGVLNMPDVPEGQDPADPGPLFPGGSYSATLTPTADAPMFSIATMIVPSNDTFAAFGPEGIALVDENGPRSDEDIAADIEALLGAWDAGSEANQSGAGGRFMAPMDDAGMGDSEGDSTVRPLDDPVWAYPNANDVIRVMVTPMMP